MNWLEKLAEKIALWVLTKARKAPDVTSKEFQQLKREFEKDFGKEFK